MAIKASAQVDLVDLTDGYSISLENDNHTFQGNETGVSGTQTLTSKVTAMCGAEKVACTVGTITTPTGISVSNDGKSPEPTLTITATTALTTSGSFTIPISIGDITIGKVFSYAISFKGAQGDSITITSQSVTYQASSSGTTPPTGTWSTTPVAGTAGQYIWTRTIVTYSDGKSTTAYSVSRNATNGTNGTSVTVSSSAVTYQASSSGTTVPTGTWSTTPVAGTAGQYIWTRTIVTYSDGKTTTSYAVSRNGTNGNDAITIVIISSGGTIFKNTSIATTLTAHVYKGATEVTGSALTALGTIKWYKDGATTATATGTTLTISAGDITNKGTYEAKLEG